SAVAFGWITGHILYSLCTVVVGFFLFRELRRRSRVILLCLLFPGCPMTCIHNQIQWQNAARPFERLGGYGFDSADGASRLWGSSGFFGASLVGTSVGDAELKALRHHMEQLPHFPVLILSGTKITDSGLEELYGLTRLRRLDVTDTD